ncbi:hypothetical protein Bca4012_061046 [Brassica carinata]|uniref:Transmembrane protein n=1 Tax=Brassica carinata TaxID=52824 RepID=A0A8X7V5A1_BRACI|nr:hypothetical protein Bca52824_031368 [Brassica carinata]
MFNIIINGMEIIWRTTLSTLMLFFFLRYFDKPPSPPNPLLIFFFLSLILFLFIIHSNHFVYKEAEDFSVLCTFEEDSTVLDHYAVDKSIEDCCYLTRYCHGNDDDCFSYYGGFLEVDYDGDIWNADEDYSQWNEDDSDDGIEKHDDDDHGQGDDDDDTLTTRINDYIASVYNGWSEERRADKLFV